MKKVVLGILFIVSPFLCMAQESRTEYNFLRLPVSAHAAALGGDNITLIADDASLLFNNPALLGSVSDKTLNLNYMNYMSGVQFGSAAYVRTTGKQGTVAATVQYINYGKMAETDENNIKTGEFSAKDIVLGGTFSYELSERMIGGITAKFITSYIGDYNSLAVGVDLGINYYDPDRQWSLSAVAKNLGGQLKAYNETYEKMPFDLQIGVSKRVIGTPFRLSAAFVDLHQWNGKGIDHLVAGVDAILSDHVYIAAGYNFRRSHEMKTGKEEEKSSHGAGFSLGTGLQLDRFKLHLAYGKYHISSSSLILNLAYTF